MHSWSNIWSDISIKLTVSKVIKSANYKVHTLGRGPYHRGCQDDGSGPQSLALDYCCNCLSVEYQKSGLKKTCRGHWMVLPGWCWGVHDVTTSDPYCEDCPGCWLRPGSSTKSHWSPIKSSTKWPHGTPGYTLWTWKIIPMTQAIPGHYSQNQAPSIWRLDIKHALRITV